MELDVRRMTKGSYSPYTRLTSYPLKDDVESRTGEAEVDDEVERDG